MAWIKNEPIPPIRRVDVEPQAIFRKLYRPLGEIAFAFADLEARLTQTLNLLLGTSRPTGTALEWFMQNVSLRIELFYFLALRPLERVLTDRPSQTQARRIEAHRYLRESAELIYGELKQANGDRNNLLHGAWTGLAPDLTYSKDRFQAQSGKLTEIPVRGISLKLLKDEANYIISVNMRLTDWGSRARIWHRPDLWPPPLPDRFLLRSPIGRLIQENRKRSRKPQPAASPR
jgi:hypothetical protein